MDTLKQVVENTSGIRELLSKWPALTSEQTERDRRDERGTGRGGEERETERGSGKEGIREEREREGEGEGEGEREREGEGEGEGER